MYFRFVRAERMKLRRSFIWLALIALPLLAAFLGTFNYWNNRAMLTKQWYSLWTQHALFYCVLFAPALTGVYCAYICRLEHLNHNWNTIMTLPCPTGVMILGKLTIVSILSALTQIFIGILFIISGKLVGITEPIPIELLYWLVRGWLSLNSMAAVLLFFALTIRSFAIPVALGLLGGFVGLAIRVQGYGAYYVFSLLSVGMCSFNPSAPMDCSVGLFITSCLFYLVVGVGSCVFWIRRHDTRA